MARSGLSGPNRGPGGAGTTTARRTTAFYVAPLDAADEEAGRLATLFDGRSRCVHAESDERRPPGDRSKPAQGPMLEASDGNAIEPRPSVTAARPEDQSGRRDPFVRRAAKPASASTATAREAISAKWPASPCTGPRPTAVSPFQARRRRSGARRRGPPSPRACGLRCHVQTAVPVRDGERPGSGRQPHRAWS